VRVTHPFHPLSGRQLVCVDERYNRYGRRLLLRVDEDQVCSVPPQWTDVVAPDPEVALGGGRSLFRVADLLELADLVSRLVEQGRTAQKRKANNAAFVKPIMPQEGSVRSSSPHVCGNVADTGDVRALDKSRLSGIVVVTSTPEIPCRSERTPRSRRSSRRGR
jgi:hypothetical protein